MFGLFKRTKIEDWEIQLLKRAISKLPNEYFYLINQINDGLFRNVMLDASDIPGYVSFGFHHDVFKKYERKNERAFKYTNIKVYDSVSSNFLNYEIYVSSGTINGYSLDGNKKRNIDLDRIDVTKSKKIFIEKFDYNRIVGIFSEEEKAFLNPSEIYTVNINGFEYFHLRDIEDGDFIGIDSQNNLYKITHDPLESVLINRNDLIKLLGS